MYSVSTITVFVLQFRNDLAKQIMSGTDLNAKNYISQSAETGKVVSYSTPNIAVRGIRLPTVKPTNPVNISLLDTGGQGVIIPDVVTNEIDLAILVQYNSIKDILSEEELKETVDNTIGSTESLTIRSTIVSFTIEPQLKNESVSKPFKIVLQNNQVWVLVVCGMIRLGSEGARLTLFILDSSTSSKLFFIEIHKGNALLVQCYFWVKLEYPEKICGIC
jgi:hypothetical protein